jgi:hypothetical protein
MHSIAEPVNYECMPNNFSVERTRALTDSIAHAPPRTAKRGRAPQRITAGGGMSSAGFPTPAAGNLGPLPQTGRKRGRVGAGVFVGVRRSDV